MKELTFKKNGTIKIKGVEQPLITGYLCDVDTTSEKVEELKNEDGVVSGYKFNSKIESVIWLSEEQISVINEILRVALMSEELAKSLLKTFVSNEIGEVVDSVKVDVPIVIKI